MKSESRGSSFAAWGGLLALVLGLALIGWVLSSLNDLHTKLSTFSPQLASVLIVVMLLALILILGLGLRFIWSSRQLPAGRATDRDVATDPHAAAMQSIDAAQKQIALVTDEIARRALSVELTDISADLTDKRFTVVVFGTSSAGKTSVINALLGRTVGATDPITGTTKEGEEFEYRIEGLDGSQLRLVDTPGLSEIGSAGVMREERARELATQADLLLFVIDQDLRDIEFRPLEGLARLGKRAVVAFNKSDLYQPQDVDAIVRRLRERLKGVTSVHSVLVCAASPAPVLIRESSGRSALSEKPPTEISDVAEHLADMLRNEGKELLASNVLMKAKRISDKARENIHGDRIARANQIVTRFTWTTAGVMFVNPVPGLGALAAAAINYQMVTEIGKVFGVGLGADSAKRMARELAQVMIKMGIVGLATEFLGKALKATLVGYVAGGAIEAVAGAYLTRMAGDAFTDFFAHDQNWGDGGMQGAIERRFDLQRRSEFVAAFLRQAAERLINPAATPSTKRPTESETR